MVAGLAKAVQLIATLPRRLEIERWRARIRAKTASNFKLRIALLVAFSTFNVCIGALIYKWSSPGESWRSAMFQVYAVLWSIPGSDVTNSESLLGTVVLNAIFIFGLLVFATILAMITDEVNTLLLAARSGKTSLALSGHILLLNWNSTVPYILEQLEQIDTFGRGSHPLAGRPIVILADMEKEEIDARVLAHMKKHNLEVHTRTGKPYKIEHLERVATRDAAAVLLLHPEATGDAPGDGDDESVDGEGVAEAGGLDVGTGALKMQTMMALSGQLMGRQAKVVVQMPDAEDEGMTRLEVLDQVLAMAGHSSGLVQLPVKRLVNVLSVQSAIQPQSATIYQKILQQGVLPNLVFLPLPTVMFKPEQSAARRRVSAAADSDPAEAASPTSEDDDAGDDDDEYVSFQAVRAHYGANFVMLGYIATEVGETLILNPTDDTLLMKGDVVVALANTEVVVTASVDIHRKMDLKNAPAASIAAALAAAKDMVGGNSSPAEGGPAEDVEVELELEPELEGQPALDSPSAGAGAAAAGSAVDDAAAAPAAEAGGVSDASRRQQDGMSAATATSTIVNGPATPTAAAVRSADGLPAASSPMSERMLVDAPDGAVTVKPSPKGSPAHSATAPPAAATAAAATSAAAAAAAGAGIATATDPASPSRQVGFLEAAAAQQPAAAGHPSPQHTADLSTQRTEDASSSSPAAAAVASGAAATSTAAGRSPQTSAGRAKEVTGSKKQKKSFLSKLCFCMGPAPVDGEEEVPGSGLVQGPSSAVNPSALKKLQSAKFGKAMMGGVANAFNTVADGVTGAVGDAAGFAANAAATVGEAAVGGVTTVAKTAVKVGGTALDAAAAVGNFAVDGVTTVAEAGLKGVTTVAGAGLKGVTTVAGAVVGAASKGMDAASSGLKSMTSSSSQKLPPLDTPSVPAAAPRALSPAAAAAPQGWGAHMNWWFRGAAGQAGPSVQELAAARMDKVALIGPSGPPTRPLQLVVAGFSPEEAVDLLQFMLDFAPANSEVVFTLKKGCELPEGVEMEGEMEEDEEYEGMAPIHHHIKYRFVPVDKPTSCEALARAGLLGADALLLSAEEELRDNPWHADACVLGSMVEVQHLLACEDAMQATQVSRSVSSGLAVLRRTATKGRDGASVASASDAASDVLSRKSAAPRDPQHKLHVVACVQTTSARAVMQSFFGDPGLGTAAGASSAADAEAVVAAAGSQPSVVGFALFTYELLVPGELEGAVLVQAAQEPFYVKVVYELLCTTDGCELYLVNPTAFALSPGEVLSFAEVQEVGRMLRKTVIGVVTAGRVVLVPPTSWRWTVESQDRIAVIAESW